MTLALQNLPPSLLDVIRTAERFSTSERLLLAKALLDSLVLEESSTGVNPEPISAQNAREDEAIVRERDAFIALHPTLLKQYPNEHVAIHQGVLVDHDQDGLALSVRVHQRFPHEFVWIAPLKAQALEKWVIRSPRFEPISQ